MSVKNLAIILTPNLMPSNKGMRASSNLEMAHHFKIIEVGSILILVTNFENKFFFHDFTNFLKNMPNFLLQMFIENAERIGKVPNEIVVSMISISNKKSKKKRRSGSITRMFTGLKKIVSSRSSAVSEWDDSIVSTPENLSSLGKRKNTDASSTLSLSAKK